ACSELASSFWDVVRAMSLGNALVHMGNTTYQGIGSSNEADASFKPLFVRPFKNDRPTIVFVSGDSHSYNRLKVDTHWWLENTSGDVKIVVVISISRGNQKIRLEQWEVL